MDAIEHLFGAQAQVTAKLLSHRLRVIGNHNKKNGGTEFERGKALAGGLAYPGNFCFVRRGEGRSPVDSPGGAARGEPNNIGMARGDEKDAPAASADVNGRVRLLYRLDSCRQPVYLVVRAGEGEQLLLRFRRGRAGNAFGNGVG